MGEKQNVKEMKMFDFQDWLMSKYYDTLEKLKIRLRALSDYSMKYDILSSILEVFKTNGIYLLLAWKTLKNEITIGQFTQYFTAQY